MFGGVQSQIARLRNLRVNISTLSLAIWDFGIKDLSWGKKKNFVYFFLFFVFFCFFVLVNKCLILYSILKVFFLIEDILK